MEQCLTEPDVNSFPAKVIADPFTTHFTFPPEICFCVYCAIFLQVYPHLPFISLYRTHRKFFLIVESLTPQHCWLAVFCLLAAVLLLYSPVVIYLLIRPLPYCFHHLHWSHLALYNHWKAIFFFSQFPSLVWEEAVIKITPCFCLVRDPLTRCNRDAQVEEKNNKSKKWWLNAITQQCYVFSHLPGSHWFLSVDSVHYKLNRLETCIDHNLYSLLGFN